jgi:hypothetical protein
MQAPGLAACGNVHFPPNGTADYDYGNQSPVLSTALDWKTNWPNLLGIWRSVRAADWGATHHGYMVWWHDHLPRRPGLRAGRQANWWKYAQDFNRYPESR